MVSKTYLHDIQLSGNALLGAVVEVLASPPTDVAGRIYYDSGLTALRVGTGSGFTTLSGGGYTDEDARDAIGTALTAGANITITPNDGSDIITIALTASTALTGTPTAPTAAANTSTTQIATTAYAKGEADDAQAAAIQRANHTGTQLASTISDFDTQVRTSRLDQMAVPTASVSLNSQKITNLLDGTAAGDAVNLSQVQALFAGRNDKGSVRAAVTTNVTLASAVENGDSFGGVTLATGDRVALMGQTTTAEKGIYTVNASGAPTRATDFDASSEIKDATFWVETGTLADTQWKVMNDGTITLGSTDLTFTKVNEGAIYTASTGLTKTGTAFSIDHTVTPQLYSTTIGDGVSTSIVVTHNLGTRAVQTGLFLTASTYDEVDYVCQHTSTNTVTYIFNTAPASNAYTATVQG